MTENQNKNQNSETPTAQSISNSNVSPAKIQPSPTVLDSDMRQYLHKEIDKPRALNTIIICALIVLLLSIIISNFYIAVVAILFLIYGVWCQSSAAIKSYNEKHQKSYSIGRVFLIAITAFLLLSPLAIILFFIVLAFQPGDQLANPIGLNAACDEMCGLRASIFLTLLFSVPGLIIGFVLMHSLRKGKVRKNQDNGVLPSNTI